MRAIARAQPNIALIKYWGKRDLSRNLPAVGSISITLSTLYTEMSVAFDASGSADELSVNGSADAAMLPRLSRCLDRVAGTPRAAARIESRSNFPIAAGLASSASAFAAATVAAAAALGIDRSRAELANLAGQASGSAARSLYGGFVELANAGDHVTVSPLLAAADWPQSVVVAITSSGPKPVGSGEAMEISRKTSPFYGRWVEQQPHDLEIARDAIREHDFDKLATIAEHNCLKMHSVMWASRPPVVYWNAATLECMHAIRELRAGGVQVFFTIDAGPQVKAICPVAEEDSVRAMLTEVPGVTQVIVSRLGEGASVVGRE